MLTSPLPAGVVCCLSLLVSVLGVDARNTNTHGGGGRKQSCVPSILTVVVSEEFFYWRLYNSEIMQFLVEII